MKLKSLKLILSGLIISSGLVFYPLLSNKQANNFSLNKDTSGVENKIPSNVVNVDLTYRVDEDGNAWISGFKSQEGDQYLWVPATDNNNHPVVGIDHMVFSGGRMSFYGIGFAPNPNFRSIGHDSFSWCRLTTNTEITGLENTGLQTIHMFAFQGFEGQNFTSIGLPSSVNWIQTDAFSYIVEHPLVINANWNLDQLNKLRLPITTLYQKVNVIINVKNPTYNQHDALLNAYQAKFSNKGEASLTINVEADKPFDITDDGKIFHREGTTLPDNLVIPPQVHGKDITGLRYWAFRDATNINSVSFAKGSKVKLIEDLAFYGCSNLTNATLPDTLTWISSYIFGGTRIQNINIPSSVIHFAENCFAKTSLETVIFNNSDPDSLSVGRNVFNESPLLKNIYIHQDLNHANYQQTERLKQIYLEKFNNFGTLGSRALSTWYDSNPQNPTGELNFYGLNQQYETTLGDGFKRWKEASNTRSISLEYTTSDNSINVTGHLYSDNLSFSTTLRQNTSLNPNISRKIVTITPRLVLTDSSNNSTQTISLKPVNITLSPNDNIVSHEPEFTKDTRLNTDRDKGLWAGNDQYVTNTEINKAYFGNDWNNIDNIKDNLSTYFKFTNNSGAELPLTKNNDYWFNNQLGAITVDINEANETTYNVRFSIQKGRDNNIATLSDQTINCYLKLRTENTPIFSIQTYSANKFKPNITFSGNGSNVSLSLNNQTQRTTWNLDNQTFDLQIAKNDFDWYANKGYSFEIDSSRFNNKFIGIGSDLIFNKHKNQFSVSVNLKTPNIDAVNVNVSGLKVVTYKPGETNVEFNLPTFNVTASKNDNITTKDPLFNKDNRLNVNRDNGLWFGNDTYTTSTQINKAYFGNDWNNIENIKKKLSTYFKFTNNSGAELPLIKTNDYWFNNQLGAITVDINEANETTYNVRFSIQKGRDNNIATLSDQTINCYLKPRTENTPIFNIKTYSANKFKPNITFSGNGSNVNLSLNNQFQKTTWNLGSQTFDSQIAKNDFDWCQRQGYSFKIDSSSFNNQFIGIEDDLTLNDDKTQFSVSVNLKTPNINAVNLNVSGLKVIAYKLGAANLEFNLPTFNVNSNANNNYSSTQDFTENKTIDNGRQALWINGDETIVRARINKAYFGDKYSNFAYIKDNFDQFINVNNGSTNYSFDHVTGTDIYTNNRIGQMEVASVDPIEGSDDYQFTLNFSIPDSADYQLLDQDINFFVNNAPTTEPLFILKTLDKNAYDPDYSNFSANPLVLTTAERDGTLIWNDQDQTRFANLGNTNTCKWAASKGYTLSVEGFSDQYINLDSNATFDVTSNTLHVEVHQKKSVFEQTTVNVSNLKLVINDGATRVKVIDLPTTTVTLGAPNTKVTHGKLIYSGSNNTSLNNKGDMVKFDLLVPEIIKPENTKDLINKLKFNYVNDETIWSWDSVPLSESGVYKFTYKNIEKGEKYILTLEEDNGLTSDINPIHTYHITLTKDFDGHEKKDINVSYIGASSMQELIINVNEWKPTLNLGAILGSLFAGILGLVGISIVILYYYKKRNKAKWCMNEPTNSTPNA